MKTKEQKYKQIIQENQSLHDQYVTKLEREKSESIAKILD
jgi:hypothetical protein